MAYLFSQLVVYPRSIVWADCLGLTAYVRIFPAMAHSSKAARTRFSDATAPRVANQEPESRERVANPGPFRPNRWGRRPSGTESSDAEDCTDQASPTVSPRAAEKFTAGKRERFSKSGDEDFVVSRQVTIKGGFLAEPLPIKTIMVEGTEMMDVRSREPWLSGTATGMLHRRDQAFELAAKAVRVELVQAMVLEVAKQKWAAIDAAASGRRALGVEDDSSSESGESPQKRARGKCQPHMQPATVDNMQLVEIEYGGIRFKACKAKKMFR